MSILSGSIAGSIIGPSGGGGTSDYTELENKPSINGVTLNGNKTTSDLDISYNDLDDLPTLVTSYNQLTDKPTIPTVVANPAGTASDTLDSINVDGTIYGVGGGSITLLNDGTVTSNTYTLTDDISNYDLIVFNWLYGTNYGGSVMAPVSFFTQHPVLIKNTDSILFLMNYQNNTTLYRSSIYGSNMSIHSIYGIKL